MSPSRSILALPAALLLLGEGTGASWAGGPPGLNEPQPAGAFLGGIFPPEAPGTPTGWTTGNAFPALSWTDPIWMTPYPGTDHLILVEKTGRIYRFENRPDVTTAEVDLILDWSAFTETSEDGGFYTVVFHPEFGQAGSGNRGYVYVCYNHRHEPGVDNDDQTYWRITRFNMPDGPGGVPDSASSIDPASETILISQFDRHRWHNGGAMFFGTDGFLYACNGDGGPGYDGSGYSQKIDLGLFGGILRLDVDMNPATSHAIRRQPLDTTRPVDWPPSFSQNYFIPNDNPFVEGTAPYTGPAGVLEEFYALGLRSPHTMQFDPATGQVWIGDVGQRFREELSMFRIDPPHLAGPGGGPNFQWAFREGDINGPRPVPSPMIGVSTAPVLGYARTMGGCVIGGFVYRGALHQTSLGGKLIFGDHAAGRIWTLSHTEGQPPVVEPLLTGFHTGNRAGLANICRDRHGEVYFMDLNGEDGPGGTIQKLGVASAVADPPAWLSQTGAFTGVATLTPAPFMVPYTVASPLYSDDAHKQRWIVVPNDGTHDSAAEQIVFDEKDNWIFPEGTVLVKHFELVTEEGPPPVTTRLETRFIVCTAGGGKYGVTYRWLPDGTDAYLLGNGETATFTINEPGGGTRDQEWIFPSRGDCLRCHNSDAGQALGVRTHQLNGDFTYPATGRRANQLLTWNALGMFDSALTGPQLANFLAARALDDETAPLEHRVRSYLDANCAHCHRPGAVGGTFDARLSTPLSAQNLVNAPLERDFDLGPDDAVVKPMDVPMSALHFRMNHSNPDPAAMPPLAKSEIDSLAVEQTAEWINSLVDAEFQPPGTGPARALLAGPDGIATGDFLVTIVLDFDVSSVDAMDLDVTGGSVIDWRGSGHYYLATVRPYAATTTVILPANVVTDPGIGGNFASAPLVVDYESVYHDWATGHGLVGTSMDYAVNHDGDPWSNLEEFLYNFDPGVRDGLFVYDPDATVGPSGPSGLPRLVVITRPDGARAVRATFPRRIGAVADGFRYSTQFSSDLSGSPGTGWQDFAGTEQTDPIDPAWERVTIEDPANSATHPNRYGRVRVESPAP